MDGDVTEITYLSYLSHYPPHPTTHGFPPYLSILRPYSPLPHTHLDIRTSLFTRSIILHGPFPAHSSLSASATLFTQSTHLRRSGPEPLWTERADSVQEVSSYVRTKMGILQFILYFYGIFSAVDARL